MKTLANWVLSEYLVLKNSSLFVSGVIIKVWLCFLKVFLGFRMMYGKIYKWNSMSEICLALQEREENGEMDDTRLGKLVTTEARSWL